MRDYQTETEEHNFSERMAKLRDEELTEVLRKRALYQQEAVDCAIQEAIKRELIHSKEDLTAPQFHPETLRTKLFPDIDNPAGKKKIRKSIGRSFMIAGILPVIHGIVQLNKGQVAEGWPVLAFGLVWISTSVWLIRQYASKAVILLFVLTGLSLFYTLQLLITDPVFIYMNWFIAAAIYLLIVYGLLFTLRLKM